MRRCGWLGVALLAIAILTLPPVALASPLDIPAIVPQRFRAMIRSRLHMPPPRYGFESRFVVKMPHGYELLVAGEGGAVAVEITRPPRHDPRGPDRALQLRQAVTAYVARGTVTPRRVSASFGEAGRVDVRFKPSGRVVGSRPHRRCRGPNRFTSKFGVFVGEVRFRGETRYVKVNVHRVKGRVRSPLRLHCVSRRARSAARPRLRPVGEKRIFTPTYLVVGWRHAVNSVELFALRSGKATVFFVVGEESLGKVARFRYGIARAPSKRFVVDDALTTATIKPPPPFDGMGVFRAAPDGTTTWTGSLSAAFPGAPRMLLTGEGFRATLGSGF